MREILSKLPWKAWSASLSSTLTHTHPPCLWVLNKLPNLTWWLLCLSLFSSRNAHLSSSHPLARYGAQACLRFLPCLQSFILKPTKPPCMPLASWFHLGDTPRFHGKLASSLLYLLVSHTHTHIVSRDPTLAIPHCKSVF